MLLTLTVTAFLPWDLSTCTTSINSLTRSLSTRFSNFPSILNVVPTTAPVWKLDSYETVVTNLDKKKGGVPLDELKKLNAFRRGKSQRHYAGTDGSRARCYAWQLDVPRDRNGEFEPKLIPKYQRDKVISKR